jgi:hypothetical protein
VPKDIAPAPNAAWQAQTEAALRYIQMMRAGALYIASEGQNAEAGGFLETQGFSDIIPTLEELLALVGDKKDLAEREIARLKQLRAALQRALGLEPSDMLDDSSLESVQNEVADIVKEG